MFIDGTKILANANKYSFVWRRNTIRFSKLNKAKAVALLEEIKASQADFFHEETELSFDDMDDVIVRLEMHIDELDQAVEETKKVSPNPAKQKRRTVKSQTRKLKEIRDKNAQYENQMVTFGNRNSYSKTDTDDTFMRVTEDPMMNGQLKPAYNIQAAVSNQMVIGYDVFQNPTNTRTLILLVKKMNDTGTLGSVVVADMGYGSEANYRFFEDEMSEVTALIPYNAMLREASRK